MRRTHLASAAALALTIAASGAFVSRPVHAAVVPGTACSVFPSDNIWNTDISNMPVNANSATWVASTTPGSGKTHPDFGAPPYGIPFNVAHNSDLHYNFNFQYWDESDPVVTTQQPQGPYPVPANPQIEGPTDSHMLVVNADTCKLYETFATDLGTTPYSGGSGAIFDLNSDQLRPAGWTSADAAGLPIFPGLVRFDEVQAGLINHAIRFTVHNTDNSYLWPARHKAGINDPSLPPMGARFRLKAGYDISTYGAAAQVVLTAFKKYGLIVADNGADWYFQGTEDPQWNSGPYPNMIADLKRVPVSAFEAIDESSLMVSANSAQAGTAPAAPTAPAAAPRDAAATVSWTPPATGGQPILSYTVSGTPSGHAIVSGTATTAVVYGLTNGTSYTFKVTATNAIGTGPPSPASNAVIPDHRLTGQGPPVPVGTRSGANQSGSVAPGPRVPRGPGRAEASPPAGIMPRIMFLRL